jgi:arylsulfatase A-like enzyme
MLRYLAVAIVFLVIGFLGFKHLQESKEIGPAKAAVLAMTIDTSRRPVGESEDTFEIEQPPNIVLIVADDLGWRDVGYNYSEIRTPVIDGLAAEGVRLNRFYAQPSCTPTRAALMTGKSPVRLGIFNPLSKKNPTGLPLTEQTLADRLKEVGYQTALVGKWHLGPRDLAYHPNARGFDYFYGNLTGGVGYYDKVHGGGYDWQRNGTTVRDSEYSTHLLAAEAVRLISERDPSRPLFLYAAFGAPHLPNEAPQAALDAYADIGNPNRQGHAAMVTELDTAIGQIHAALVEQGIERDTVLWFMSDNGGLIPKGAINHLPDPFFTMAIESTLGVEANPVFIDFARTNFRSGGADNRPFKGGKQTPHEGAVRVPAFISWPGRLESVQYNYMATVQDVLPTLMEFAGAAMDRVSLDGRSLVTPLATDTPAPERKYLVKTGPPSNAVVAYDYPYKLVIQGGERTLFNLEDDPLEDNDIASAEPGRVSDMEAYIEAFPQAPSIALPLQDIVDDPDYFGGEEDREPWAEQAR